MFMFNNIQNKEFFINIIRIKYFLEVIFYRQNETSSSMIVIEMQQFYTSTLGMAASIFQTD